MQVVLSIMAICDKEGCATSQAVCFWFLTVQVQDLSQVKPCVFCGAQGVTRASSVLEIL